MGKKFKILLLILIVAAVILVNVFVFQYLNKGEQSFSLGETEVISRKEFNDDIDAAELMDDGEIDIFLNYSTKRRYINMHIPIERNSEFKNIVANMRCSVEGYSLLNEIEEEGNAYVIESYPYQALDFSMEGKLSFFGRGTVLNKGSGKGTEILLLKEEGLAHVNIGVHFKGEESEKVTCTLDLISQNPPRVVSKEIIFNYPGIEGFYADHIEN